MARKKEALPFKEKLILNKWILRRFGLKNFDGLATHLKDERLEGMDANNVHYFHHELCIRFPDLEELSTQFLVQYDENIVHHTQSINEARLTRGEAPIVWKYFQYLSLLFVEIYLDLYFNDPLKLLDELNTEIDTFNREVPESEKIERLNPDKEQRSQLNKLAFWSATGSGKTFLMHVNILQFQHYQKIVPSISDLNRIILLTPNEGLSRQHLKEFEESGIQAQHFNKNNDDLFTRSTVTILDIHKLREESGDKTVAYHAFENNNLVLIDEGHRGSSSSDDGKWMTYRNKLCEKGFSFEYSATFGQAIKQDSELTNIYSRCILFDYSYSYFYADGFGKDYQILNIDAEVEDSHREDYLIACLLSFYQQKRLYRQERDSLKPLNLHNPLWVFVGGRVNAVQSIRSDVLEMLLFLQRYVNNPRTSILCIKNILKHGIIAANNENILENRFAYLNCQKLSPEEIFKDSLKLIFNTSTKGKLTVENLRGFEGEIALRIGDNEAFGVINVGDDTKFIKLCENENNLLVQQREFSSSLFDHINDTTSRINILIGSKKFMEGWSSWRVSTMGMLNIGRGEGSQVIQLFGRGVRLLGYKRSLKRTAHIELPADFERHPHQSLLETLNIFGVKANYMAQFKEFLELEGLPANEDRIEFLLPVIRNLGKQKLLTLRLKEKINGVAIHPVNAFKELGPMPVLALANQSDDLEKKQLQQNPLILNWYPKIKGLPAPEAESDLQKQKPDEGSLKKEHIAFLDLDNLFFELERFKKERAWHNLTIRRDKIWELLDNENWYRILIPENELIFDSFEKVHQWQEIALALLKKYTERYYFFSKQRWELNHLEYKHLTTDDPNFLETNAENPDGYYSILIKRSETEIIKRLEELRELIKSKKLKDWDFKGIKTLCFDPHLYQPLLNLKNDCIQICPVPLNKGEKQFIEDLKRFHEAPNDYFKDTDLYLLRNMSRGRGVGFFEAGNFHPDFILWLIKEGKQYISFIDPKGIRQMGWEDPKINFYRNIKDIEKGINKKNIILNTIIVSNTKFHVMQNLWQVDKATMKAKHIVFQEDQDSYIEELLELAQRAHVYSGREVKEGEFLKEGTQESLQPVKTNKPSLKPTGS